MKANELMIGDWILYGDRPVKVLQLSENSKYDWVKPIPLTAKILGKNPNIEELGYWDYEVNVFRLFATPILNLWYIHQLQHALRLCGLNELADNFKMPFKNDK